MTPPPIVDAAVWTARPVDLRAPAVAPMDRATAAQFVDAEIITRVAGYERQGRIPEEVLDLVSAAGLWAPFLPVSVGGQDLDLLTVGAVHEEVGRGCSSLRSLLTVHAMVAWAIQRWGNADQRERWLAPLASGAVLGAFCLTEPEVGSDATRISTVARRRGADWVLTGVKKWITNGQRADLFLVFAQTERGVAAFLIPRHAPGVEVIPIDGMLGTRSSMLAEVRLCDALAGPDALLGPDGFASGMVMTGVLDLGRYSVASGSVGIVQACLNACADHTSTRRVRSGPLRDLQLIRAKLTDMVTDLQAARLLCERAGRLKDAGDAEGIMATLVAKYFASRAAGRHAAEAVQIHGAAGCSADAPVARFYRDAKIMEIIEGSSEIQQLTIADEAFRKVAR
jgi:alkylation response protein AidB-like acyl-CoA dehydrogenase